MDCRKSFELLSLAAIGLLLFSNGFLTSHADQSFSLTLSGGVIGAGDQTYSISESGSPLLSVIDGETLVTNTLTYSLSATQTRIATTGSAAFDLTGAFENGTTVEVNGTVPITSAAPALCLPSDTTPSVCSSPDTSEVPAAFTGTALILFTTDPTNPTNERQIRVS